jgi:hypothetical protein
MAFMIIAFTMAFVLKYFLAKYPYPEIQQNQVVEAASSNSQHMNQQEFERKDPELMTSSNKE